VSYELNRERWRSRNYVGAAMPFERVWLRRGRFVHDYRSWANPQVRARIPSPGLPWQATWTPSGPWVELPNVGESTIEQTYDNNGIASLTLSVENVAFIDMGGYHVFDRGAFSPLRGHAAPGRPPPPPATAFGELLASPVQIGVEQGYGEDAAMPEFAGLLEDVDPSAAPARLQLTARDFGQVLTDCRLFGYNIDKTLRDPVVFASRLAAGVTRRVRSPSTGTIVRRLTPEAIRARWIIVEDAADIVKVILRWAGFKDWEVESTGVKLRDKLVFNRGSFYVDVIKKVAELVGYVFYIRPPETLESIGIPVFRQNSALVDRAVEQVRDVDLITGLQAKLTDEPKAYIIRARGKPIKQPSDPNAPVRGRFLGGEKVRRIMDVYEPPWVRKGRTAGKIKHTVHHDNMLETIEDAIVATRFIALAQALKAATATCETPALPGALYLDEQLAVFDTGTGMSDRLWIASRTLTRRGGEQPAFTLSLGGALVDSRDVVEVRADLNAALSAAGRVRRAGSARFFSSNQ